MVFAGLAIAVLAGVFVYNVRRNYVMPDDAFISFRYADHLARGEGLVWNPGERVEGYSRLPTIDILGLNDVHVAHTPPDGDIPLAGHRHMASVDYLRQRGVVIWPAVGMTVAFDQPVLDVSGDPLFADSPPLKRPPLPLRIVKARDRYLIFVTLVPEEKFQQVFERLELLR